MAARRCAVAVASFCALAAVFAPRAQAQTAIPTSWSPGPGILYQAPATAPQLTNTGNWVAPSLLVSGAHAYVSGEFLYQGFLYGDTGANGRIPDPNDKRPQADLFSLRTGTYDYPTGAGYGGNAANLVEFRVKPVSGATDFRLTLTRLADPSLVAATIAIGTPGSALRGFPYGAGVSAQADHFLTVHGTKVGGVPGMAAVLDGTSVPARFNQNSAQIDVVVPASVWNPGSSVVRLTAGVGLWDSAANHYVTPKLQADASHPGGRGILLNPPAFFDLAFREAETPASTAHPTAPGPATSCMWRDCLQAVALARGTIAQFHDDVDFAKLLAGTTDTSTVPAHGSVDRILASHFGGSSSVVTYAASASMVNPNLYDGEYQGNLQPYNLYIPSTPAPAGGYPLTLLLHSLSANYNQYMGSNNQTEFGNRAQGTLVATAEARGPDGWYYDRAEADVFEMWTDIARHYTLDLSRTAVTGYSMGGYAGYRFGTRFPDLFAKDFVTVGPPADGIWTGPPGVVPATGGDQTNTYFMLESLRWLPILIWHGTNDELVPAEGPQLQSLRLDALNYRYEIDTFPGYDHFAFAFFDNYTYPARFLDSATRVVDPPHISYVVNPTMDFTRDSEVADHVYWLGGLTVRSSATSPRGVIDVRSEDFGHAPGSCVGDAKASATQLGAGVAATPYLRRFKTWGPATTSPCADVLDITATNIGRVVVDVVRAQVDCNARVVLHGDGPVEVDLVSNGTVCRTGTLQPASAGSANPATLSGSANGLPNTAATTAEAVAVPAGTALLAGALIGRRRRRKDGTQARP